MSKFFVPVALTAIVVWFWTGVLVTRDTLLMAGGEAQIHEIAGRLVVAVIAAGVTVLIGRALDK